MPGNVMSRKYKEQPTLKIVGQSDPQPANTETAPIKPQLSFDAWFMQKGLKSELKNILKKHFDARGFMASKEFDTGLKDFGI